MGYVLQPLLLSFQFGDRLLPVAQGLASTINNLCGMLGPMAVLSIAGLSSGYAPAYFILGAVNFCAAFLAILVRKRHSIHKLLSYRPIWADEEADWQ